LVTKDLKKPRPKIVVINVTKKPVLRGVRPTARDKEVTLSYSMSYIYTPCFTLYEDDLYFLRLSSHSLMYSGGNDWGGLRDAREVRVH
jgi:hypothetical protein